MEFRYMTEWGNRYPAWNTKATLSDGSVRSGALDAEGYARISLRPGTTAKIQYVKDPNPAKSLVSAEMDDDVHDLISWTPPTAQTQIQTGERSRAPLSNQ